MARGFDDLGTLQAAVPGREGCRFGPDAVEAHVLKHLHGPLDGLRVGLAAGQARTNIRGQVRYDLVAAVTGQRRLTQLARDGQIFVGKGLGGKRTGQQQAGGQAKDGSHFDNSPLGQSLANQKQCAQSMAIRGLEDKKPVSSIRILVICFDFSAGAWSFEFSMQEPHQPLRHSTSGSMGSRCLSART